ncbi:hypothetical protein QBC41DRAFT_310893 [Cercophora samala]|uniref:Uncharacterized protein n=1 Tax=Cercophora samala TaxID=330535 RepID=A0AA39ZMJ2_9PEZI|nr:hypothetical protein QBC41DRAFT_310893 [Cercophora samala]
MFCFFDVLLFCVVGFVLLFGDFCVVCVCVCVVLIISLSDVIGGWGGSGRQDSSVRVIVDVLSEGVKDRKRAKDKKTKLGMRGVVLLLLLGTRCVLFSGCCVGAARLCEAMMHVGLCVIDKTRTKTDVESKEIAIDVF